MIFERAGFEHAGVALGEQKSLNEIWLSFASLLRSYLAAAELHRPLPHVVLTAGPGRLTLERARLRLDIDREQQQWTFSNPRGIFERGAFSLDSASQIIWQGRTLELDAAAELITELFLDHEQEDESDTLAEAAGEAGGE